MHPGAAVRTVFRRYFAHRASWLPALSYPDNVLSVRLKQSGRLPFNAGLLVGGGGLPVPLPQVPSPRLFATVGPSPPTELSEHYANAAQLR